MLTKFALKSPINKNVENRRGQFDTKCYKGHQRYEQERMEDD